MFVQRQCEIIPRCTDWIFHTGLYQVTAKKGRRVKVYGNVSGFFSERHLEYFIAQYVLCYGAPG